MSLFLIVLFLVKNNGIPVTESEIFCKKKNFKCTVGMWVLIITGYIFSAYFQSQSLNLKHLSLPMSIKELFEITIW